MPSVKRQASDSFGSNQALVKRQKSNTNLQDDSGLAVSRATGGRKDALVSSVSQPCYHEGGDVLSEEQGWLMEKRAGHKNERPESTHHGADRPYG